MPFRYVLLLCGTDCRLMLCAHPLCQCLKVVLKILISHILYLVKCDSFIMCMHWMYLVFFSLGHV